LCVRDLSVSTALRKRGLSLESIFKREDKRRAGNSCRTAGSALHIPLPITTRSGGPRCRTGLDITCISSRDDHCKVTSIPIQRSRPDCRAAGVTRLGPDLFRQKTGCWRISCHRHPQSSPSPPWDFFVTQILSQHEPSCILSQHEVCYPCAVERLVDVSTPLFHVDFRSS